MSFAGNTPPSKQVPSGPLERFRALLVIVLDHWLRTYVIKASHSKKLSSVIGPAMIPSGGFRVNSGKIFFKH